MRARMCFSGLAPDQFVPVPTFTAEFHPGDHIQMVAEAIMAGCQELSWLTETEGQYSIAYAWKQKGGRKGETLVYGDTKKGSGYAGYLTGATWHIWMAADHCKNLANYEFEAAVYHQLLHLGEREVESTDEEVASHTIPVTRPHEVEMFAAEIDRYGFWLPGIRKISTSFASQLKLEMTPTQSTSDTSFANGDREVPDTFDTITVGDFDDGGDEVDRRRRLKEETAKQLTAKGDGRAIVYDAKSDTFTTVDGDRYADGAVEEAAGVGSAV
jgi:hypothetical protein